MTILKLKAFFYRYTGVYLAQKEQHIHQLSKKYWDEFYNITAQQQSFMMSDDEVHGMLIGLWQAHNGFYRPMSGLLFYYGHKGVMRYIMITVIWLQSFYKQLHQDIYFSLRLIKRKLRATKKT